MNQSRATIRFETLRENERRWAAQADLEGLPLSDWIPKTLNQRCYDYNVRAQRGRVSKPRDVISGKAASWIRMAAIISRSQVNSTELCAELGISRSTVVRHLADMERIYGLVVQYVRPEGGAPGWYEIVDWGVLDEQRVMALIANDHVDPGN